MKTLLVILLFLFSFKSYAVNCSKHPIYCQIKKNSPNMSRSKAMKLSNIIHKASLKYKGDAKLAIAIATQETGLRNRHRNQNIIQFEEICTEEGCVESYKILRGVSDVCMFQFHVNTITNYKINPIKLKNDIGYCVDWHFRLMNIKKKLCRKMYKPWACYHSKNKHLREVYIKLVERYL